MNLVERAQALYRDVVAPLVLGGEVRPGRRIGARDALAIAAATERGVDSALEAEVQRGRCMRARRLVPVDAAPELTAEEWTMAAAFHDIVQSTHPALNHVLRPGAARRTLNLAVSALGRVPPPRTAREALFRHTIFARVFELTRKDTEVRWWTGSEQFRGTEPPPRLVSFPRLRRVRVSSSPRPLFDLARAGGGVRNEDYHRALEELLRRTPLTDLCTCTREAPAFSWTDEALALLSDRAGLRLALRGLARLDIARADVALGRATRKLVAARSWHTLAFALDLLRERSIERAWFDGEAAPGEIERDAGAPGRRSVPPPDPPNAAAVTAAAATTPAPAANPSAAARDAPRDAASARRLGAASAREWLRHHAGRFSPDAEQTIHRALDKVPREAADPELLRVVALLSRGDERDER